MSIAYISIGSNLGDRQKNIDSAIQKLRERKAVEVKEISSVVETEPVGDPSQPKFLNACFKVETGLYPDELLDALQSIERELGRDRSAPSTSSTEQQLKMLRAGKLDLNNLGDRSHKRGDRFQDMQKNHERNLSPSSKWGPRTIDLDILFYDDIIMKGNNLVIPHPLLHERLFVLRPLAEIAPDFIHPVLKKSVKDLMMEYRVQYESS